MLKKLAFSLLALFLYAPIVVPQSNLEAKSPNVVLLKAARLLDRKTGQLMSDSQPIDTTPYVKAGSPVIPIGRRMDFGELPKGSYRLDVRANEGKPQLGPQQSSRSTKTKQRRVKSCALRCRIGLSSWGSILTRCSLAASRYPACSAHPHSLCNLT